jgi:tripartite-type tricarboxylate transporter receptor subunit TctC
MIRTTLAAAWLGAAVIAMPAFAQADWPTKNVTLITAFAPGSGPDATLRVVAEKLGKLWGKNVIVENRPGGGGLIAMDAARRAAPRPTATRCCSWTANTCRPCRTCTSSAAPTW